MPKRAQDTATPNPHWLEFFRCVRREAERLDVLERQKAAPQAVPGGRRQAAGDDR